MHDSIPEVINGDKMGVKFDVWKDRDPNKKIPNQIADYQLKLFYYRNFYPFFGSLVNDMHKKGLLEKGEYMMIIDW